MKFSRFGFMFRRRAGFSVAAALLLYAGVCDAQLCAGDCDDRGQVSIEEIVRAVGITLEAVEFCRCSAADSDGDGVVTVDEIVDSLNSALRGCPSAPICGGG